MQVRLLGGFAIAVDGRWVADDALALRKARALLKLLALAPRHQLASEQLMELLWPEVDPDVAANRFHQTLHATRRALASVVEAAPARAILTLRQGVLALQPAGGLAVDVAAFEAAAERARHSSDPAAYEAAIDLYSGDLLPEDRYEDWTAERREQLRASYLALLRELAARHEREGRLDLAIEALRRVLASDPADEEAHVGLMRLHARAGQRQQALRQYHQLREALARELDVVPDSATERLYQEILSGHYPTERPAPPVAPPRRTGNLPAPLTGLIGREQAVAELRALLADPDGPRLVTLTGPGGCGKSRLALAVGAELRDGFPDGVWLVELAPLTDPALLASAIAGTLGVREEAGLPLVDALAAALRERRLLLVLDNCEHLLAAAPQLARLLAACPALRVLATSREPLQLRGEREYPLAPLTLPDPREPLDADVLARVPAVRLFIERAREADPGFVLTPERVASVAEICRRLDGLPLAIELAAARVRLFAVEGLLARLERRLPLLTGGPRDLPERHQTLRGAIGWSYDLLDAREQALFRWLSVFAGGFPVDAAAVLFDAAPADVPTDELAVLVSLDSLANRSLLRWLETPAGGGQPRAALLLTIREFGLEQLEAAGELDAARGAHGRFFLSLADAAAPELAGPHQARWLERLELEHDNLRAALDWALDAEPDLAARLAVALWPFWDVRGHFSEGRDWLARALATATTAVPAALRAGLLTGAGSLAWSQGDYRHAAELHGEALAHYRALNDAQGIAFALNNLGVQAVALEDYAGATALYEESLDRYRALGDERGVADVLNNLGVVAQYGGDYTGAARLYEESLALWRRFGDQHWVANALYNLGEVAWHQQEWPRAAALYQESLALRGVPGSRWGVALCLAALTALALVADQPERAARLGGAARALIAETGIALDPAERVRFEEALAGVDARLGAAAATLRAEGERLSLDEATAEALLPLARPAARR